jgi:thymidylate kinase
MDSDAPGASSGNGLGPLDSRGFFVAVEGCNGTGKSSLTDRLAADLGAQSFHFPPDFIRFKEETHLDLRVRAVARFAYYLAAALELSDLVRDSRTRSNVVCDRYLPSSMAPAVVFDRIGELELRQLAAPFMDHVLRPDLILFLSAAPLVAIERLQRRRARTGALTALGERLASDPVGFSICEEVLRSQATRLAPTVEIDTTNLTLDEVRDRAVASMVELSGMAV